MSTEGSTVLFEPSWKVIGKMSSRNVEEIKHEPMLWSASPEFAFQEGGQITLEFLEAVGLDELPSDNGWVIDSRVHMLMPGFYPCIPGWHCDNVPRTRPDGQPNHDDPDATSENLVAVVDCGTGSLTEFLCAPATLSRPPPYTRVYRSFSIQIDKAGVDRKKIRSGDVISFGSRDFHRGISATEQGWRFFIRASRHKNSKAHNEVRKQVQVYLPDTEMGW